MPEQGVGGAFELGQVEVRPGVGGDRCGGVGSDTDPEVEERCSDRLTVDCKVRFFECQPRVRTMSVAWSGLGIRVSPPISAVRVPA